MQRYKQEVGICAQNLFLNKTLRTTDAAKRFNQLLSLLFQNRSINESLEHYFTLQSLRVYMSRSRLSTAVTHTSRGTPVREVICYHSQKESTRSRPARGSSTNSDKFRTFWKRGSLVYLTGRFE